MVIAAAAATSVAAFNEVDQIVTAFGGHLDNLGDELAAATAGQAADDPADRLRQAREELARRAARVGRALRHDDPGAARPEEGGDRAAVAAARPQGADPGPRHRQAERRLLRGRHEARAADGQGVHRPARQPRDQRRLRRLQRGGRRDRLRLHRHRPPLLQRQLRRRSSTPRSTSSRATRSSAARTRSTTCATATTTTTSSAAARQQDFLRQAKAQVGVGKLIDDRGKLIEGLRQVHATPTSRAASRCCACSSSPSARPAPDPRGPLPGRDRRSYVTASQTAVQKVTRAVPRRGVDARPARRGRAARLEPPSRRRKAKKPSGSSSTREHHARRQAAGADGRATTRAGCKIFYPRIVAAEARGFSTASPRVYKICGPNRGQAATRATGSWSAAQPGRRVLRPPGHHLEGPADPRGPVRDERASGGREFELHYDGDRLRLVAWRTNEAVYWVSNTLLQTLSERADAGDRPRGAARLVACWRA